MLTFFFVLWILLNGRVTVELIVLGGVIAAFIFLFAKAVFGFSLEMEKRVWLNAPLLFVYFLNLIWEIIKAALAVMKLILKPGAKPDPVLVEFDSGLQHKILNVLLANSITLTPGTYTVRLEKDHLVVHCLIPEYAQGIGESSFVKLLRKAKLGEKRDL